MTPDIELVYRSPLFDPSGYAVSARCFVHGLDSLGARVCAEPVTFWGHPERGIIPRRHLESLDRCVARKRTKDCPFIFHVTPENYGNREPWMTKYVGYTMFETTSIPTEWLPHCELVDEIWTPTTFSRDSFINGGVPARKVHIIPLGVDTAMFQRRRVRSPPISGLAKDDVVFTSVFQWTWRKGPDVLLAAYFKAFTDRDNVALVLRCYRATDSQEEFSMIRDEIRAIAKEVNPHHTPKVILIEKFMTRDALIDLLSISHAYILLSRGEAWGLDYSQAASMGLPVIYTDWGGQCDFLNSRIAYPVRVAGLTPVGGMPWIPWYKPNMRWAEPSIEHAVNVFREIYNDPERAREKGALARKEMVERWRWERPCRMMLDRLQK